MCPLYISSFLPYGIQKWWLEPEETSWTIRWKFLLRMVAKRGNFQAPRDQGAFARPELSTSRFHLHRKEHFPPAAAPQTHTQSYLSHCYFQLAAAAKLLQSCPTLCNPIDSSPPGSPVPGILQARTREWVAISFSNAWKWKVRVKSLSRVWLLATPWTAAHQAPPSMGFSRQECWSGVPLPSPKQQA